MDADETMLGAKLDDAEARATAQRRAVEEIDARALAAERRIEALTARREMLIQEVSRAHDPAALLEGVHGIAGRVIDQVRAAEGYERALRAALGPLSDAVLATSRADAMAALERLKRDGGRASIAVPGASIYAPVPVGVRSLLHVVSSVGPHADLVRGLLSGIALADSLAEAAELSRAHPGIVVVTRAASTSWARMRERTRTSTSCAVATTSWRRRPTSSGSSVASMSTPAPSCTSLRLRPKRSPSA